MEESYKTLIKHMVNSGKSNEEIRQYLCVKCVNMGDMTTAELDRAYEYLEETEGEQ